jgi:hypothetical protein
MAQTSVEIGKKQKLELNSVLEVELPEIVLREEILEEGSRHNRLLKLIKKGKNIKEIRNIQSVKNNQNYRLNTFY